MGGADVALSEIIVSVRDGMPGRAGLLPLRGSGDVQELLQVAHRCGLRVQRG